MVWILLSLSDTYQQVSKEHQYPIPDRIRVRFPYIGVCCFIGLKRIIYFRSRLAFKILHIFLGLVTHLIPICPSMLTPTENIASYRLWFLRFLVEQSICCQEQLRDLGQSLGLFRQLVGGFSIWRISQQHQSLVKQFIMLLCLLKMKVLVWSLAHTFNLI